jgi:hypothetical protein
MELRMWVRHWAPFNALGSFIVQNSDLTMEKEVFLFEDGDRLGIDSARVLFLLYILCSPLAVCDCGCIVEDAAIGSG